MTKITRKIKIRVGVMRGGPSSEHDISLNTGEQVLKNLPDKYEAQDIFINKSGRWHLGVSPKNPDQVFKAVDVIFNALHGEFGEDGKVQQILETFQIPYTGSQILSSALAMKKHLAREVFEREGLKLPRAFVFRNDEFMPWGAEQYARQAWESLPPPWVVKPSSTGSSVGINICGSITELKEAIDEAFQYGDTVMVEEFIKGREATCGVLENFRNESKYTFPVVEIIPPDGAFFDRQVKYDGSTREICPADFDLKIKKEIEKMARKAHQTLACRHYSRADFIVSPRGIYLLEVNTLPGLTAESLLPKAAQAAGLEFPDLLDHLVQLALSKR